MNPMIAAVRLLPISIALLGLGCAKSGTQIAGVPDKLDFNWDVRPILSDNCFSCHGPDAAKRKAGLRLDVPQAAFGELPESPGKHAVVPGKPEMSEMIRRITAANVHDRMPPAETHKVLSDKQIAIIKKWVEDGAAYKPHWAFITPKKPKVPKADFDKRATNEVDRFVFARLKSEGLTPAPEADKRTLINRVTLTLTGLPPSLAEVDAFVADSSRNAYEKLVDRLLASPAYAENMASYWMDLARWSESDGFLDDHHDRFLWPWRDWVIEAFNKNMPYDQFATWQLAGDLLPNHTRDQLLATAFLRVGPRTTENGAIDEEYRIEYAVDRTNTVGNTFMGLTVGCARCHDHKYDPISHKDYYSLTGFFNSTDEPGFYAPGQSGIQGGPTLPWPTKEQETKITAAEAAVRAREAEYAAAIRSVAATIGRPNAADSVDEKLQRSLDAALTAYYPFETTESIPDSALPGLLTPPKQPPKELVSLDRAAQLKALTPDGKPPSLALLQSLIPKVPASYVREQMVFSPSGVKGVAPAVLQAPILKPGKQGKALYFDEENKGFLGKGVGYYDRSQAFSFDLWFYPAEKYPEKVPVINHRDDDNSGGAGYRLELEQGRLHFYMAHSRPFNMIAMAMKDELPLKQWSHISVTYDGSSRAAGLKLYVNGRQAAIDVIRDNLSQSILPTSYASQFDSFSGAAFGSRFREKSPVGSGLDEIRFFKRALTPIEVAYLHEPHAIQDVPGGVEAAMAQVDIANDPRVVSARDALVAAREEQNKLVTLVRQVLVMGDTPVPRPTYLLDRGVYSEKRDEVPVQALVQVFPWEKSLPANRVGLAKWLFDPRNPLTARVFVNRIWQMHFGRGLVETAEDFGAQGSIPSHPELLDWLAVDFIESGWDIKALHKKLVMTATYRQSSNATDELLQRDPRNVLLARSTRQRMPAEMVRDQALAAAGLLVRNVGGPSVHPYQPEGVWNPRNSFFEYPAADKVPADEHHRRSLYTFIKRSAPHPGMQIFDFADRTVSTSRRRTSNTPLQALELMNDPQYVEAYRQLASHAYEAGEKEADRLTTIFQLARRQSPSKEQLDVLSEYYAQQQERFAADPQAAQELLKVGVTPVDAAEDPVQLAALTNVTAVIMNSPDAYTIR